MNTKTKFEKLHSRLFDAQITLANKKDPQAWVIKQTENGWFIVEPRLWNDFKAFARKLKNEI